MITHSFIVCAFLAFSLAAWAETIPEDNASKGIGLVESLGSQNAILHKDVDLHHGPETRVDLGAAEVMDCAADTHCRNANAADASQVQTFSGLLVINERSSGKASALVVLLLVAAVIIFLSRCSPSTK
jgi:hypothetical protein